MRKGSTFLKFLASTMLVFTLFSANLNAQVSCGCACDWYYWNTGSNATVLVNGTVLVDGIDPTTYATEVFIGAFYDSLGFARNAGYVQYLGGLSPITVWGAQGAGTLDGFASGETMTYKLCVDGVVYDGVVTYAFGSPDYSTNGLASINTINATSTANLSVAEWLAPQDGCGLSAASTVTCSFWNSEAGVITDTVYVSYSNDSGATWVNEFYLGTINPGDTVDYTFATPANFSGLVGNPPNQSDSVYSVMFQISFGIDADSTDNILSRTVTNAVPPNTEILTSISDICLYGIPAPIPLTADPVGGTWSGEALTFYVIGNNFLPGNTVPGSWDIYYNFNDAATGCTGSDTITVNTYSVPDANFTNLSFEGCQYESTFLTASPTGGEFIGSFIDPVTGEFYPLSANTYPLSYAFEDANGCRDTAYTNFVVWPEPNVTLDFKRALCSDGDTIHLHGFPIGASGVYTVDKLTNPQVTDSILDPSDYTVGQHFLDYEYTDEHSCYAYASMSFKVFNPTQASISGLDALYCLYDDSVMLTGLPAGGTWTGTSANGYFNPSSIGQKNISYLYLSEFNWQGSVAKCDDTTFQSTMVYGLPQIDLATNYTINAWGFLSTAQPDTIILNATPGYQGYLWNNDSTDQIITTLAGYGDYAVTVTDNNGCNGSDTITIGGNDIKITRLISPLSDCTQEAGQKLKFVVKNTGTWPIFQNSSITIKFRTEQQSVSSAPYDLIGGIFHPGDSIIVGADSLTSSTYNIDLITLQDTTIFTLSAVLENSLGNQPEDVNRSNDTLIAIIENGGEPVVNLGDDMVTSMPDTVILDAGVFADYAWSNGALDQELELLYTNGSATYCVTVTDRFGCVAEDCINILNGITEEESSFETIKIYPNPSSGIVIIEVANKDANELNIDIIDIQGRVVEHFNYQRATILSKEVDLSKLSKGIYYVKFNNTIDTHQAKIVIE